MPEPELQRYLPVDGEMTRHDEGNFVYHYDARVRVAALEAKVKRWRDAAREVIKNSSHESVRHECFAREVKLSMLARDLAADDIA